MNTLTLVSNSPRLARFTVCERKYERDRLATSLTAGTLTLVMLLGSALMTAQVPTPGSSSIFQPQTVRVSLDPVAMPVPVAVPVIPTVAEEIPRLDPHSILNAPVDKPTVAPLEMKPDTGPDIAPDTVQPPRRVYGVRKVYAKSLGTSGGEAGGLVTKLGNTLGGVPDTLTATAADLHGELAALSTIDEAPQPIRRVRPDYSPAMRKARAQGLVSAYLLIDADGTVKDVKITADIGWDSRAVATAALRRFSFRPALKNGQPVAVWILHHIRFELQE